MYKRQVLPEDNDYVSFAGIHFKQTTTCPTTTISSKTYYESYIFGEDALLAVDLGKTKMDEKNYRLPIKLADPNGSVSDPAGMIGGWVAYNCKFTVSLPPNASTGRLRRIQSETGVS